MRIRLALIVVVILFGPACGDSTGSDRTSLIFTATLDGVTWVADTVVGIASGSATDTTLSITGVRQVSPSLSHQVTLVLHAFRATGEFPLSDSAGVGIGAFSVDQTAGGVVVATTAYRTGTLQPGVLRITSIDRGDSLVSGTFAFEAAADPDTLPHRHLSGTFVVRFGFIPVYTVPLRDDAT